MNLKKIKEQEIPLLNRTRVNLELDFEGPTPNKKTILKDVSSFLKVKEDLIYIRHVYQKYGLNKAKIIAHVYKKIEDLRSHEKIKETKAEEQEQKTETKKEEVKVEENGKEANKE